MKYTTSGHNELLKRLTATGMGKISKADFSRFKMWNFARRFQQLRLEQIFRNFEQQCNTRQISPQSN